MMVRYFIIFVLFLGTPWVAAAQAASTATLVQEANTFFHQGHYHKAVRNYEKALQKKPESAIIHFNLGTAYYKSGRYADAVDHLQQAFLSDNKPLQAKAHYNAGNALYQLGHGKERTELSSAISDLKKAVTQYNETLRLDPKDSDAQFNREFVRKELKRIKKKQQEQKRRQKHSSGARKKSHSGKSQQNSSGEHKPHASPASSQGGHSKHNGRKQPQSGQKHSRKQQPQKKKEQGAKNQGTKKQGQSQSQPRKNTGGAAKGTSASGSRQAGSKEMTPQEARDLINNYEQTEEPRGLLNFMKGKGREVPVLKNW